MNRILAVGPAVLMIVALSAGVAVRTRPDAIVAARPLDSGVLLRAAPPEGFSAAMLDLELPCIPEAGQAACSEPRLRLWIGEPEAWALLAAALGGAAPTEDALFWEVIRFRWEAGDPAARAAFARAHGWPHLRLTSVRFRAAPAEGLGEYIEVSNLGGGPQELTGWRLRPTAHARGASFQFAAGSVLAAGAACRAYVGLPGADACAGSWTEATADVLDDRAGEVLLTVDFPDMIADRNAYAADPTAQLPPPALRGVQETP